MTTPRSLRAAAALAAVAGLTLAACSSSSTSKSSTETTAPVRATVAVADPWVRESPAASTMGAAYMTLTASVDDRLLSASVPASVAAAAQIHESVEASPGPTATSQNQSMGTGTAGAGTGETQMREIGSLALPAGEPISLAPGGYHIMLIDLAQPLTVGQEIPITLTFQEAGQVEVTAPVRGS